MAKKQFKTRCDGKHGHFGRRDFMQVGALSGLGMSLPGLFRMEAMGAPTVPGAGPNPSVVAKSVIHVYLGGGMAHQESWDPKPFAPSDYRGPFQAIDTKIKGEKFGSHFKRMAQLADKITVIRSMTHGEAAHERGTHNMFTGYRPSPAIEYPSMGAVVSHELGVRNSLPPYVMIPKYPAAIPGGEFSQTGYLSSSYGAFGLGADPNAKGFTVRDLALPKGLDTSRFSRRKSLLSSVDHHFKSLESTDELSAMDTFYERAYGLISSQKAREAFELGKEDKKLRDSYGYKQPGQSLLMARRLVEAGVRFVSVIAGGWDHHGNIKQGFDSKAPALDQSLAALITDLENRGMLDETLLLVSGEFGRTPKINPVNGRDHWPRVFSVMMAGGGVSRGQVYGASDSLAGGVEEDAVTPEDLTATIYHQLGINPHKRLMAPGERPIDLVRGGKIIHPIVG